MKRRTLQLALVFVVLVAAGIPIGAGAAPGPGDFQLAGSLTPDSVFTEAKSVSGRLAQTDPSLLGSTSTEVTPVMVKLDYDAIASYAGGLAGLPATSPSVTKKSLKDNRVAVAAYRDYIVEFEDGVESAVAQEVPQADVNAPFRLAYGGLSVSLPKNEIGSLLTIPGVAAVQRDALQQPLVVEEPYQFIGAEAVWNEMAGNVHTGEGVVVANLDTGVWPENPMFEDEGLAAPPGGPYPCEFGLSGDLNDPAFTCTNKLVGAKAFLDTYTTFLGAEAGEFCDTLGPDPDVVCSARDADGHGTHTLSTAAGDFVDSAEMWGGEWGPTSGMAPGAHAIMYRVCLNAGCFTSDSVAAVNQAILDDVDVINFSISGGNNAFTDAVELAFLDFYASGGLANASAGNAGPGPGTANHAGPWTNTVGASYSSRQYAADLHLQSSDGSTLDVSGVTITPGIDTATPVTRPVSVAGYTGNSTCNVPFAAGSVAGKIVFCDRGNPAGRADSGFNVLQGGGAGMILANVGHQDLFTDLHWVPTIMVDDGTWQGVDQPGNEVRSFVATEPDVMATFTTGTRTEQMPDIMTTFSSRGPLGDWIKPDVTAPGIQILAGRSPVPNPAAIPSGPPGDFFMAIAGTSMSSPHAAGVAALVKAAHPSWTPGQIKSALMTSSVQAVLQPDGLTPADPFNTGAGSIRANRAIRPTLTFDQSAAGYAALAADPLHRIDANLPSINAPTFSGSVTTTRTAMNVTSKAQEFTVRTQAPAGARIVVQPRDFVLVPGQSIDLDITIQGENLTPNQQYFGAISLDARRQGATDVYIPVAFFGRQGVVSLQHTCDPTTFPRRTSTSCEVESQNFSASPAVVSIRTLSERPSKVDIRNESETLTRATGSLTVLANGFEWTGTLDASIAPTIDSITSGGSPAGGYLPLSLFGVPVIGGMGDETIANFNVPGFLWGEEPYTRLGVTSNGYIVVGGGTGQDVEFEPQTMPDPARPNNVIAPWWTDLDLSASGGCVAPSCGARIGTLTDGFDDWIVVDYENVPTFGAPSDRHDFQIWLGLNTDAHPAEDVTMAHGDLGTGVPGFTNAGAENRDGSSGINMSPLPGDNTDWTINTSPPTPGGKVEIVYDAFGKERGTWDLIARMTSDQTVGTTIEVVTLTVT